MRLLQYHQLSRDKQEAFKDLVVPKDAKVWDEINAIHTACERGMFVEQGGQIVYAQFHKL